MWFDDYGYDDEVYRRDEDDRGASAFPNGARRPTHHRSASTSTHTHGRPSGARTSYTHHSRASVSPFSSSTSHRAGSTRAYAGCAGTSRVSANYYDPYSSLSDFDQDDRRETRRTSEAAASAEKDFVQHVLSWRLGTIHTPLADVTQKSVLPNSSHDIRQYYERFIPLILEESRSMIAAGLKEKNSGRNKGFSLNLDKFVMARNAGNPSVFDFKGRIPHEDENSYTMNVLLLSAQSGREGGKKEGLTILALASVNGDNGLRVKAIILPGMHDHNESLFRPGQRWNAWYLCSLVNAQRMFDACTK